MIEIEMSKDIREYEPKVIGIFTKRQLVCVAIGAACGLLVATRLPVIDPIINVLAAVIVAMPASICGWIDLYGMHLETYVLYVIQNNFLTPNKRKYKSESLFYESLKKEQASDFPEIPEEKKKKKRKVYPKEFVPYD